MPKIMVIEDEDNIADTLKYNFLREGYDVTIIGDGKLAFDLFKQENPDLLILDVMLPGINGLDLCRQIRQISIVPILILSAREEELDKILGLELGADDYMTKPFNLREVIARVRALLRRMESIQENPSTGQNQPEATFDPAQSGYNNDFEGQSQIKVANLFIDSSRHTVTIGDRSISLKPKEFDLLLFLARHAGDVVTREMLLEQVWGYDYDGGNRTVDVHIRWLREKIEPNPAKPHYIYTVFGVGYKLVVE